MTRFIDLTGMKYGKLTVISRAKNDAQNRANWECICSCGKLKTILGARLRDGITKSCGCLILETHALIHDQDITGKRIGSLVAIIKTRKVHAKGWEWELQCDCGKLKYIFASAFNAGKYKSCGCKKGELIGDSHRTHGKSTTYAYWLRSLAKKRAKNHNLPFNLSIEYVEKLIIDTTSCPYLGIPIKSNNGALSANSATIDRKIPSLGYVEGNVMLISHRANTIKSDATKEEVMAVAIGMEKYITHHISSANSLPLRCV